MSSTHDGCHATNMRFWTFQNTLPHLWNFVNSFSFFTFVSHLWTHVILPIKGLLLVMVFRNVNTWIFNFFLQNQYFWQLFMVQLLLSGTLLYVCLYLLRNLVKLIFLKSIKQDHIILYLILNYNFRLFFFL